MTIRGAVDHGAAGRCGEATAPALALAQAFVFISTGLWPLFHMRSFQAVTGPKVDGWLVNTVGALLAVVGMVLAFAGVRRWVTLETGLLGAGSSAALAGVDVYYVARRRISPVYLLDAVLEAGFVTAWVQMARAARRSRCR